MELMEMGDQLTVYYVIAVRLNAEIITQHRENTSSVILLYRRERAKFTHWNSNPLVELYL
jgi:hypothetical protein